MIDHRFLTRLRSLETISRCGRVIRVMPTYVEADGPNASLGALCEVEAEVSGERQRPSSVLAKIVGVGERSVVLAPFEAGALTFAGARVSAFAAADRAPVGDALLGRALDGVARPLDGLGRLKAESFATLDSPPTAPLDRASPRKILHTGIRAIDGLLTLGQGQRVGIFAAAGVGKTTLITQLANQVEADRCVVCLVGERGREVEAFWSDGLAAETKARTTLIAATSDQAAAMRVRAADYALTVADHWRGQGKHVLLLLDSVTRLAMALREIGLAAGEPPTVRAYTPSVFAAVPRLVERCGALKSGGSVTAIMTVLSETDDVDDPVSEMMKSLLDGHILLSRNLAEQGRYPAIDVPRSVSRLARGLVTERRRAEAEAAARMLSVHEASRTLIEAGVYAPGSNADIDQSLQRRPALLEFLKQGPTESTPQEACWQALAKAVEGLGHDPRP